MFETYDQKPVIPFLGQVSEVIKPHLHQPAGQLLLGVIQHCLNFQQCILPFVDIRKDLFLTGKLEQVNFSNRFSMKAERIASPTKAMVSEEEKEIMGNQTNDFRWG